jgi:flagellar motility protein MotE (MotC chaperone)
MRVQPRVLPVLCAAALVLLGVKVASIMVALDAPAAIGAALAQTAPPQPLTPRRAAPDPAGPTGTPAASAPTPAETPASRPARDPGSYSSAELEMLQSLAERRAQLDRQAEELAQREVILRATEQRIEEKIAKLQTMQASIDETFKKQDEQDDAKLRSLVRIYETMKPKEAARIFEQLDTPVLLGVLERMKESKTAPILAAMEPAKAKAVTIALAERRAPPAIAAAK